MLKEGRGVRLKEGRGVEESVRTLHQTSVLLAWHEFVPGTGDPVADLAAPPSLAEPPIVAPKPPGPMDFIVANAVNLIVLRQHSSRLHMVEFLCTFNGRDVYT